MANQDTDDDKKPKPGEEEVDTSVDTDEDDTSNEDEDDASTDAEDTDEDDSSEDEDDSGESDEDDSDEDDDTKFKKQFPQIKGDTLEEYTPNLEETYRKSSREGKRLAQEKQELQTRLDAISAAVAKNPELAKLITEATGDDAPLPIVDPALLEMREERNKRMEKEYNEFIDEHPELESDEDLQQQVLQELAVFGEAARKNGKTLSMADGLKKAWVSLGLDKEDSKEKVAGAAKASAARGKVSSSPKKAGKSTSKLTPEQVAYGKRMGLTEKQMLEFASS